MNIKYIALSSALILSTLATHADSSSTWIRRAGLIKYRTASDGSKLFEYDNFYYRDQITDTATGYQKFTSWANPSTNYYINSPGPAYTEDSTYTQGTSFHYEYESSWGINVSVTSPGGANVDAEIDYNERASNGTLGSSTETHTETKVVGTGTFLKLWANFKADQAKYVSAVTVTFY
jgi:hypothetical protein